MLHSQSHQRLGGKGDSQVEFRFLTWLGDIALEKDQGLDYSCYILHYVV